MRLVATRLLAIVFTVVALMGVAAPASAGVNASASLNAASVSIASKGSASDGAVCAPKAGSSLKTDYLPVYRWSDATNNLHTRYSAVDIGGMGDRVVGGTFVAAGFAIGNTAWSLSTKIIETATQFCPLDKMGGSIDRTAAKIAKALISSGLVAGIFVVTIVVLAFRGMRGGAMSWKALGPKAIALGVFVILMTGAMSSTGGGINGSSKPYVPGVGSPGWFAISIDRTIAELTSMPVDMLTTDSGDLGVGGTGKPSNELADYKNSCKYYVTALNELYTKSYGDNQSARMVASTPKAMSAMWEVSGLRAWRRAQFGSSNWAGPHMYCYALEKESGVPPFLTPDQESEIAAKKAKTTKKENVRVPSTIAEVTKQMGLGEPVKNSYVWAKTTDNDVLDVQLVALAQCKLKGGTLAKPQWTVYQLAHKDSDKRIKASDCTTMFTKGDLTVVAKFDWPPRERSGLGDKAAAIGSGDVGKLVKESTVGNSTIDVHAGSDGARDFLRYLHGDQKGGSLIMSIAYVMSAVMVLCAFGMIGLALIVAKITALMVLFGIYFMLLGMMLPNADSSKVGKFVKQYVGLSFFIFGFQLLLAILVLITKLIIEMGDDAFGGNDFMNMMWTGFAPILALIAMNIIFRKMGLPSPTSITSGGAWGKAAAAGAIGGAAGGALGSSWGSNRALSKMGSRVTENMTDSLMPGRAGRGGPGGRGDGSGRAGSMRGKGTKGALTGRDDLSSGEGGTGGSAPGLNKDGTKQTYAEGRAERQAERQARKDARAEARAGTTFAERRKNDVSRKFNSAMESVRNDPMKAVKRVGVAGAITAAGIAAPGAGVFAAAGLYGAYRGTKGAVTQGVSAAGTRMNMDTQANRQAMEIQANRRQIAAREQAEAERAQREADDAARLQRAADETLSRAELAAKEREEAQQIVDRVGPSRMTESAPSLSEFTQAAHPGSQAPVIK